MSFMVFDIETRRDPVAIKVMIANRLAEMADPAASSPHTRSKAKALTNPETLAEFETFVERRGENKLKPEQRDRRDELRAAESRAQRAREAEEAKGDHPAPPPDRWLRGEVEPWQMTRAEMLSSDVMHMKYSAHSSGMGNTAAEACANLRRQQEKAIRGHQADVARALAEGKPVPAEVLADYPDLAPTLPTAAAPAVPQPPPAVDTSATARKEDSVTPLTPETLLVGDILISDAGLCVVVELEQGGYVTVRPLDGARFTPLAPADLALFRKTGDKDLKPALLRHLEQNAKARLADLQDRWGYSRAMGNTPETNPLNRALKDLVDSGLVTVFSDDWGYATNPLIKRAAPVAPETPPAPTGGNPKPLGDVPVTDETRYFGTELTVTSHGELIQTWLSRIYNLGTVFECHNPNCPHDPQATFRVPGDQVVSIDRLVDRQLTPDAPLPQVPPLPDTGADLTSLELGAVYRDFLARQMSVSASPSEAALQQYARAARDILNGRNPAVTPEEFARFVRVRLAGSAQGFALADLNLPHV